MVSVQDYDTLIRFRIRHRIEIPLMWSAYKPPFSTVCQDNLFSKGDTQTHLSNVDVRLVYNKYEVIHWH